MDPRIPRRRPRASLVAQLHAIVQVSAGGAVLACLLLAPPAWAALCQAVKGDTATPMAWNDPGGWSCDHVPGRNDDVVVEGGRWVECPRDATCAADDLRVHGPTSGLIVRGTLRLYGCHDAPTSSAYANPSFAPCSTSAGATFRVEGWVVHDSVAHGDVVVGGRARPDRPDLLRLELTRPVGARPGDVLQIRAGPERNHVYEVAAVENGPPAVLEVRLYDPEMSYRTDPQTASALIDLRFFDGGSGPSQAELVRVAASTDPRFASDELDRCVQICRRGGGDPFHCDDAGVLHERVSPVGWFLGIGSASPADVSASVGRRLVTHVENDVPARIAGTSGTWDLLCLAEPLPDAIFAGRTDVLAAPAALWPGFQPGDAWRIFSPARVVYAGGDEEPGDGMLSFFHACLDADYAWFEDFARMFTLAGTPACQRPFQDTVFTSWEEGRPGMLTNTASAGGCNGEQPNIVGYAALSGDRVAVIDTRSPTDTSGSCDTNGSMPGGLVDGDPLGSTHGVSINGTRFDPRDPPRDWFFRYLGDDGSLFSNVATPATTYVLDGWTYWYNRRGESANVADVNMFASATDLTIILRNARVTNWTAITDDWCNPAFDVYPAEGSTIIPESVAIRVEDVLWIDTHRQGMIHDAPSARSELNRVWAFGRDTGAIPSACAVMESGSFSASWIDGWSYLVRHGKDVLRTRYRTAGESSRLALVTSAASETSVRIEDSALLDLGPQELGLDRDRSGTLTVRRSTFRFASPSAPSKALGGFWGADAPALDSVEGNLVVGPALLGCGNVPWAAANEDAIGANLLVRTAGAPSMSPATGCPDAAVRQIVLPLDSPAVPADAMSVSLADASFGPAATVGVPISSPVYELGAFTTAFLLPGSDRDHDGVADAEDVCPHAWDPDQSDSGGVGSGSPPDGTGDACQCGDVSGDGRVTLADALLMRRSLLVPSATTLPRPERCDVGGSIGCTLTDAALVQRALLQPPAAVLSPRCAPALP